MPLPTPAVDQRGKHDPHHKFADVKLSFESYRKMIKAMKISFTKLGEEKCEVCLEHSMRAHKHDDSPPCDECMSWDKHVVKAKDARKHYRADASKTWSSDFCVRSVDMQKVVMLPRLPGVKSAVFTKRIVVFNETFAALGGVAEKRIKKRKNIKSTKKNAVNNNKHTPRKKKKKNHGK